MSDPPAFGLTVGTLSSELTDSGMSLAENGAGVDAIMDAIDLHSPDVLVAAGYSLKDSADLALLESRLNAASWDGLLFIEVRDYQEDLPGSIPSGERLSEHCMFAWTRDGGLMRLGRQYVITSDQARGSMDTLVRELEEQLPDRVVEFRGRRFGALICGEINVIRGRNDPQALTPGIDNWMRALDIVVNPTHDRMGNYGTVKAKRRWISSGGRAYISASNWHSGKGQRRGADTLHSVFVEGSDVSRAVQDQRETYEYREARI